MCDYSMEHLRSVKATVGEQYKFDNRITHGFVTKDSKPGHPHTLTVACCTHGMRLQLSGLSAMYDQIGGRPVPRTAIVTVVQQREDRAKYRDRLGPYNDGIEFEDGRVIPIAYLVRAEMEVLPAEQPKRNLTRLFDLTGVTIKRRMPELIDGDD